MLPTLCACNKVRRAARALTHLYDDELEPSGLKTTQFILLRSVERLGDVHISRLAEATGLDRSTLGRNLRPLERLGLVELTGGSDHRTRVVRLTREGRNAIARAVPGWENAQRRVADALGIDKRNVLFGLLDELERLA